MRHIGTWKAGTAKSGFVVLTVKADQKGYVAFLESKNNDEEKTLCGIVEENQFSDLAKKATKLCEQWGGKAKGPDFRVNGVPGTMFATVAHSFNCSIKA